MKYAKIIQERYSVGFKGGCIPMEAEAYVEEYNRVMEEEIAERFGGDTLEKAWAEAQL